MGVSTEEIIQHAISWAKAGNKEAARKALSEVVRQEPNNARAWYLLSQVIEDKEKVIYCLQKVLVLLPDNQHAKERLTQLLTQTNILANQQVQLSQIQTPQAQSPALTTEEPIITPSINIPTKKCPYCARMINADNRYCSFCGGDLSGRKQQAVQNRKPKKSFTRSWFIILGVLFFVTMCSCGVFAVFNQGVTPKNSGNTVLPMSFNETDAIRFVQDWKPRKNNGLTCKEMFDTIAYAYRNNMDIYDARVEWRATKQGEQNFTVFASLKGETGWANYSWNLNVPNKKISTSDSMTICPPD